MKKTNWNLRLRPSAAGLVLIAGVFLPAAAQDQRWLRVGETQSFFVDYGTETELVANQNYLTWPTQYGDNQHTTRQKSVWIGARNFYDPVEKKIKGVKVIGAGPRLPANNSTMLFPQYIKLVGRSYPPTVVVDNQVGTSNTLYDALDDMDENLPADRMVEMKFNTSMGVTVTKRVYAFTQQNHDNYFIHDYVFKNTGIINAAGAVYEQPLHDVWFHFGYRYAFAGITSSGFGSTWGAFGSEWGGSTLNHAFGIEPTAELKGFYSYYSPEKSRPLSYAQEWGCPNQDADNGLLGAAKYTGAVTLHADQGPHNPSNDPAQPATTAYLSSDSDIQLATVSQYDESFMGLRYDAMSEGHLPQPMDEAVGDGYVEDWAVDNPERDGGGGTTQGQGFGPYQLESGDSIHIVFAEGVTGLSWPMCREIGGKWFAYFKGTGTPALTMPDGSTGTDPDAFKKAWVQTGVDSIMQMFRNAKANYASGYSIPQAPPAPETFTVTSGGDRIRLSWADNAESAPHFDGYVIFRSESNVKIYQTVYAKVFECNASDAVHTWDDTTAVRGFNYYYYIQSKDDGSQNDVEPGKPLYSSLFLTLTSVPAYLLRPAGNAIEQVRVVPNPYDIRARSFQFGDQSQYDRIAFYGLPPQCSVRVYTERGDLVWSKDHTNGAGDELWDSMTSSRQIVVSGIYLLYVEVTEDGAGFRKGESVIRKFVVIR
jgi:hypothetical protein